MRAITSAGMLVAALLGSAGCSSSASTPSESRAISTVGANTAPLNSPTGPSPAQCPNPEGLACIGPLTAHRQYTTVLFDPAITYSVPAAGWNNFEDLPGNFLLVPPGNDLAGVNAGTSDFIGVYASIAAARFTDLSSCADARIDAIGTTPHAIAGWIGRQRALDVTAPTAVTVGGLHGVRIDVRVRPGARLPTCVDGTNRVTVFLLFIGLAPSSLDHGVIAGMTMRLYLLARGGATLAIEVDDIDRAPVDLARLAAVAESLQFGR